MKVDIAPIKAAIAVICEFNKLDLADVELWDGDERLPVPQAVIDRWKFTGLSNKDFVWDEAYRPEFFNEADLNSEWWKEKTDEELTLEAERMMPPIEILVEMAKQSPTPQSWFEEDFEGLC